MKSLVFLLPLVLLLSSARAIDVNWQNYDGDTYDSFIEEDSQNENLVGGSRVVGNLQSSTEAAERVANGVFDLYRLLASDPNKLNQIVSNLKQVVGNDTYNVNHVFKHVRNGNYYLEVDTDKFNFAVNIVRMAPTEHSNHIQPTITPSITPKPTSPPKVETTTPPKPTSPPKVETTTPPKPTSPPKVETTTPPKPTSPPKVEPNTPPKPTSPPKVETTTPPKPTSPPKVEPTTPPKPTSPPKVEIAPEDEYLRKLEDKRFNQILGQWYRVGVESKAYSDVYAWRACEIITIFSHSRNYFYKEMKNIGNSTYDMKDTPMTSVDKKNNLFKMNNDVHAYKMVMLEGKNYKIKLLQITNISNKTEGVQFYAEQLVNTELLTKVFNEHYKNLFIVSIDPFCYKD